MAATPKYRARLDYQEEITAGRLNVMLNFDSFVVLRDSDGGYGDANLTFSSLTNEMPFYITREDGVNYVYVDNSIATNPFSISIEALPIITVSDCFAEAVREVVQTL